MDRSSAFRLLSAAFVIGIVLGSESPLVNQARASDALEISPSEQSSHCSYLASKNMTGDEVRDALLRYGVRLTGTWLCEEIYVLEAVKQVSQAYSIVLGKPPISAFKGIHGDLEIRKFVDPTINPGAYGFTKRNSLIWFDGFYPDPELSIRLVVHELGHAFDYRLCETTLSANPCKWNENGSFMLAKNIWAVPSDFETNPMWYGRCDHKTSIETWGFAGGYALWQFGELYYGDFKNCKNFDQAGEIWADMYLGWVFRAWGDAPKGSGRKAYMDQVMRVYLERFIAVGWVSGGQFLLQPAYCGNATILPEYGLEGCYQYELKAIHRLHQLD